MKLIFKGGGGSYKEVLSLNSNSNIVQYWYSVLAEDSTRTTGSQGSCGFFL